MPRRADFILQINIRNIEDFSPGQIVKTPRIFRQQDLKNACANLALEASSQTPASILALARYVSCDFFCLAHITGLYNRQIRLWEGLARIAGMEIYQARKGLFQQEKLPEFDFVFFDRKKQTVALAHLIQPEPSLSSLDYLKSCREFLKRASLYQEARGLFLCYPRPFPGKVLEFVRKETKAFDSIARYESILPKLGISVNLLEMEQSAAPSGTDIEKQKIRLIHPDLSRKKPGAPSLPAVDLSELDRSPADDSLSENSF